MYNLTIFNKTMKRFFVTIATLAMAAAVAAAQDYNAAVDAFNAGAQALETNKVEALAQFRAALAQAKECTEDEAVELVAKCQEAIPGTLFSIAKEQINEGSYDEAVATLAEVQSVAAEYGNEGIVEEAKELVPNVYLRKGSTLLKAKDFDGAEAAFAQVTALTPEDAQAFMLLGQARLQKGDIDNAIASLTRANELGEEKQAPKLLATSFLKKGQALLKEGKNAQAIEALEASNKYQESANAYKLMASAFTKSGKSAQAIDAYKKYLQVAPDAKDAADIQFTIAATAQKAGDKATATEYYKKLAGTKYAKQAEDQLKVLK